jgi:hypothetical protein
VPASLTTGNKRTRLQGWHARLPNHLRLCTLTAWLLLCAHSLALDPDPALRGTWPLFPQDGLGTSGRASEVVLPGNYAYVANEIAGLQVIDVSDPANPQRMGGYDTSGESYGVAVAGNYAYVADGTAGLQVIDVSDPANPKRVGGYNTSGSAREVALSGNYAYAADGYAGLQVIDVSNPANPKQVGGYQTVGDAVAVALVGTIAFVVDRAGLEVIDISNPANPQRLGGYPMQQFAGAPLAVAVSENYAYVADDFAGLHVIDVRNPAVPRRVGGYDVDNDFEESRAGFRAGVAVSGDYAYVRRDVGMEVIDVSNPTNPQGVGGNSAAANAEGVFVTTNHVFVAAGERGLSILSPFTPLSGPPLWFAPSTRLEQGGVVISLQGLPGLRVEIERSVDLLRSIGDAQAHQFPANGERIKPVAIDSWRPLRQPPHECVFLDGVVHACSPEFRAGLCIRRENKLSPVPVADGEHPAFSNRHRMDPGANAGSAPDERRTADLPLLE